ncbi:MAG TPA: hypothetical protein PLA90_07560 [Candidatus Sumerlaeota bacterium]|nr:hypothetical protein [Candidatus Sumerlaeota bacterium]
MLYLPNFTPIPLDRDFAVAAGSLSCVIAHSLLVGFPLSIRHPILPDRHFSIFRSLCVSGRRPLLSQATPFTEGVEKGE